MTKIIHPSSCACCGDLLRGAFSRRHFVMGAAAFGAATALRFNSLPGSASTLGESTRP